MTLSLLLAGRSLIVCLGVRGQFIFRFLDQPQLKDVLSMLLGECWILVIIRQPYSIVHEEQRLVVPSVVVHPLVSDQGNNAVCCHVDMLAVFRKGQIDVQSKIKLLWSVWSRFHREAEISAIAEQELPGHHTGTDHHLHPPSWRSIHRGTWERPLPGK